MPTPLRIAQLSDLHINADRGKELLGVNTQDSLRAVLNLLKKEPIQPDLIILSGDLSQDGSEESYLHIAHAFADFPVPIYCLPGNHDDSLRMSQIYPKENLTMLRQIVLQHWQIILLDSQKPESTAGYLDKVQLNFMQHCLQMYPEHHAIVVFHHHPLPVGSTWLDKIGLTNADEFWQAIAHFPMLKHILFGHVHQQFEGEKNKVQMLSAPSTCIQFKRNSAEFHLEKLNPGYRFLELYPEGHLISRIERTTDYVGNYIVDAKGY